jgi:hypothetical protein
MAAGNVKVGITTNRSFKGAEFDGVDDYVNLTQNPIFKIPSYFSISLWVLFKTLDKQFIAKSDSINSAGWFIGINSNKYVCAGFKKDASNYWNKKGDTELKTNQWYHIYMEYIGNGTEPKIYVNNVLQSLTTVAVIGNALNGFTDANQSLEIGRGHCFSGSWNYCKCIIRNVKYYKKILSSSEIDSLAAGADIDRTNLVGEWLLKDNYLDTSGNGNHGTNSGTHFEIMEDAISEAIKAQRVTANDKWLLCRGAGGQVIHAEIEEA